MTDSQIVLTMAGSLEEARKIAHVLVERRLAACVNIIPGVESIYRWQEKVETAGECLLVVKTQRTAFAAVRDMIKDLHSYDLPECVALAIADGSDKYLKWIHENTV